MKLKIKVVPNSFEREDGFDFCTGEIQINTFVETFDMALSLWDVKDYERQWKEGLERIKIKDVSCLVSSIQDPKQSMALLNWWPLYKVGNTIFIQNHFFVAEDCRKKIEDKQFTPENCYDFIDQRVLKLDDGDKPSEWTIKLEYNDSKVVT